MADTEIAVREDDRHDSLRNFVAMALRDDTIDVPKLEALLRMQREIEADWRSAEYNRAMNAAQAEITPIARTTKNTQTSSFYAKLEEVDAEIRPIYLKHGFSLSYNTVAPLVPGNIRVECRCGHIGGHSEKYHREAPADTLGPKGAPVKTILHGGGSTETYLKRYLACGIFNVVFKNQDDDGVRGGMEFIDEAKISEISALLTETKSNLDKFLETFRVNSVSEILAKNYPAAIDMLRRKQSKMGGLP